MGKAHAICYNAVMQNPISKPGVALGLRISVFFVIAGVALRLVPHPWDFTPTRALALFAGAYLSTRLGVAVVLGMLLISDIALGLHATMAFTWVSFLIVMFLGRSLAGNVRPVAILGRTLAGATIFFLITNLGVFLLEALYPKTWAGFLECYVMALPFFRNSITGDLVYAFALFGGYAFATSRLSPARSDLSESRV